MKHVIQGVAKFQSDVFPKKKTTFKKLAHGQNPEVLFITCSDSRIDPNLVTQTEPGELFICRNAGNVIPPHSNQTGGMTASIEFAVAALGVTDVIICGHTDCGAMKGALHPDKLAGLPHVAEWLGHCRSAVEVLKHKHQHLSDDHLDELTCENVVQQIQHIKTHPAVAAKIASGELRLHGWMYDIESGAVTCWNSQNQTFEGIEQRYSDETVKP